jgi:serine/threonine protein kinase
MKGDYKFGDGNLISEDAKDLVDQLLKNDPNERISLDNTLKHRWFTILSGPRKKERKGARANSRRYNFLL